MNLLGYIKKFGHYDFKQRPFNNVDATICIALSYLNFELYLKEDEELIIKDIPDENIVPLCAGELTTFYNRKLVKLLRTSPRYQNGVVRFARAVHDKETATQFFALTFFLPDVVPIICFRGTDLTIIGWKEDLMMALNDAILSHIEACDYINEFNKKYHCPFMVGGHSKGGNIALYSAIHCSKEAQDNIVRVYNLDGPGFRSDRIFHDEKFFRIKNRLIQIFPEDDVVGTILNNSAGRYIIKAKHFGVFQHNHYFWIVSRHGSFKYLNKTSRQVKIRTSAFYIWMKTLSREDCLLLIDTFMNYFGGADANLIDFFRRLFFNIKRIYKFYTAYPKETRLRLKKATRNLSRAHKYCRRYYRTFDKN